MPRSLECSFAEYPKPSSDQGDASGPTGERVSFVPVIRLTKSEAIDACDCLESVQRILVANGHVVLAAWAALLIEEIEDRMMRTSRVC
jgi:hypothetical protein